MDIISAVIYFLKYQVQSNHILLGIIIGMIIIILESVIPMLPLAVFIAINMLVFGNILGFFISWIATIIGCILSFTICRKGINNIFYSKIKKDGKINKFMKMISQMSFSKLVLITALPFTPAFAINIACGLSNITYKKFILMVIISKISIVYFWGFIGTTFIESITDISVLIKIGLIMLIMYLISKIIVKKFKLD